MSKIQRWGFERIQGVIISMGHRDGGEWVTFIAHEAEVATLRECLAERAKQAEELWGINLRTQGHLHGARDACRNARLAIVAHKSPDDHIEQALREIERALSDSRKRRKGAMAMCLRECNYAVGPELEDLGNGPCGINPCTVEAELATLREQLAAAVKRAEAAEAVVMTIREETVRTVPCTQTEGPYDIAGLRSMFVCDWAAAEKIQAAKQEGGA